MDDRRPTDRWSNLSHMLDSDKGRDTAPHSAAEAPRGLYMYGGVGTGKTMLMDLFVRSCPPEWKARVRVRVRVCTCACASSTTTTLPLGTAPPCGRPL